MHWKMRLLWKLLAPDISTIVILLVAIIAILIVCLIILGRIPEAIQALVSLAFIALAVARQISQKKGS